MKKIFLTGMAIGFFLVGNFGVANALYLYGGTDVGAYDDFWSYTEGMISSEQNELDWINEETNGSFTELYKTDTENGAGWYPIYEQVGGIGLVAGGYAFQLQTYQPEYWLIKTGNLTPGVPGSTQMHYLFKNVESLDWAVLKLNGGYPIALAGVGQISHVSEVGTAPVPEPTTLLLFGTGLLGLAGLARRKRN